MAGGVTKIIRPNKTVVYSVLETGPAQMLARWRMRIFRGGIVVLAGLVFVLWAAAPIGCGASGTVEGPGEGEDGGGGGGDGGAIDGGPGTGDGGGKTDAGKDGGASTGDGGGSKDTGNTGNDTGGAEDTSVPTDTGTSPDTGNPGDTGVVTDGGQVDGGVECQTKDECPLGNVCEGGRCQPGCDSVRDCPQDWKCDSTIPPFGLCVECTADADCGNGLKCVNHECRTSCDADNDCAAFPDTPKCDTVAGACVACLTDDHCNPGFICESRACIEGCKTDRDCPAPQKCDPASGANGACYECTIDAHCLSGKTCKNHICSVDCSKVTCSSPKPICNPADGSCVECLDKADCNLGEFCQANVCVTGCQDDADCSNNWHCKKVGNGVCVECLENYHCSGGKVCLNNACSATAGCLSDTDCFSGKYCHPRMHSCEALPAGSCDNNDDCKKVFFSDTCDPLTRLCIPACFQGILCFDQVRPYCDSQVNGCYECLDDGYCDGTDCRDYDNMCEKCAGDSDCIDPSWHCDTSSGGCHECLSNAHCTPNLCDASAHQCVQCLADVNCTNPSFPTCGKDKTCIPKCSDDCVKDDVRCDPTDATHESYQTCGDSDNDPCLEFGYASYCPDNQWCQADKCVCKPPACTEGAHGCDAQYPTTVYVCVKDSNGCIAWEYESSCTSPQKCSYGACK